jgi:phenylalanyl-tRNA synthetase beta chain
MRIPLSWIKEYINLSLSPAEIAKKLTLAGIEVDKYETMDLGFEGIIVGQVLDVQKHPNADKLCVASVTDGQETYQVVCGASNCRKGMKTAFAPIGATLKEENGGEFKIKKSKLRGVESFGMLCAGQELGISSAADGIMDLPEHFQVGDSLKEYFSDTIFEISLTPNLNHCSSVIGIVRELSAATGLPIRYPKIEVKETEESMEGEAHVDVLDQQACPRYTCRLIKGVKVAPSPDWLRLRLELCGLRSVNNIVDITNYVLLELGHPLHAFDYNRLDGHQIIVKKAEEGSTFQTLDGKERQLKRQNLLIGDRSQPVAIAGVMGGSNSEVQEETQDILLESAYFDPVSIRKTSKQLGLQTDSSKRFERGTDPNNVMPALNRAAMLMEQLAGGKVLKGIIDIKSKEFIEKVVNCRLSRIHQILGIVVGTGEVENIFQRLGFRYTWDGQDVFKVSIPTYRVDIQEEIDLIEEVARLYGYDNVSKEGGGYKSSQLSHAPIYLFEKEILNRLIAEGLQEFLTCDLIGPSLINIVQDNSMPSEAMISVLNPTSIEQSILRTSLLPGLLQVVKYNVDHQNKDVSGFEVGRIHFKEGEQYKEQSVVGIILTGKAEPAHWGDKGRDYDFFDLKGIVENLLQELGIENAVFKNLGLNTFHSGRQASVFVNDLELGSIGEVHPAILRRLDVAQRIFFAEFNLHDLVQVTKRLSKVVDIPIYPGSERDWTVTVSETLPIGDLLEAIKTTSSSLLEDYSLLDIYRSDKLGHDVKNVTLHFVYRDPYKTIAQEVVDAEHQRVIDDVLKKLEKAVK